MEKLEDKFIPIVRSNVVQTPRACASNDDSCEFYDPASDLVSKETMHLDNGNVLEVPKRIGEFHNYYIK